jgi:hypothetical protein
VQSGEDVRCDPDVGICVFRTNATARFGIVTAEFGSAGIDAGSFGPCEASTVADARSFEATGSVALAAANNSQATDRCHRANLTKCGTALSAWPVIPVTATDWKRHRFGLEEGPREEPCQRQSLPGPYNARSAPEGHGLWYSDSPLVNQPDVSTVADLDTGGPRVICQSRLQRP